jgi:hypothetical protein
MPTTGKLVNTASGDMQTPYGLFVFLSFLVWLILTSTLRLWGHTFFITSSNLVMSLNFLWPLLLLPLIVYGIFHWQNVQPQQRTPVSICLAIPSMLLDIPTTYFFPQLFPNMPSSADGAFGAWLLWAYIIVLLTGLVASRWQRESVV